MTLSRRDLFRRLTGRPVVRTEAEGLSGEHVDTPLVRPVDQAGRALAKRRRSCLLSSLCRKSTDPPEDQ